MKKSYLTKPPQDGDVLQTAAYQLWSFSKETRTEIIGSDEVTKSGEIEAILVIATIVLLELQKRIESNINVKLLVNRYLSFLFHEVAIFKEDLEMKIPNLNPEDENKLYKELYRASYNLENIERFITKRIDLFQDEIEELASNEFMLVSYYLIFMRPFAGDQEVQMQKNMPFLDLDITISHRSNLRTAKYWLTEEVNFATSSLAN